MRVKLTWISTAALALGLFAAWDAAAEYVYRWTDDEGKVHYTVTLPPEAADRPYDILSSQGVVIKSVSDPTKPQEKPAVEEKPSGPAPLYTEREKQTIGDRLLLLKYHSEQEILDAMELEIDHLKYDERLLKAGHDSAMNSLAQQIRSAANKQRAGKPITAEQHNEIRQLQTRIVTNRTANADLNLRKDQIRETFNAELNRYRELRVLLSEEPTEG